MLKRIILPVLFGLMGAGVLVSLGVWQVGRLAWKAEILAEIDQQIAAAPVALPERPQEARDQFLPVAVEGQLLEDEIVILASHRQAGPVYRIVRGFETDGGRRIMVDMGFVHPTLQNAARPGGAMRIAGNLHWPDEVNRHTPAPDLEAGLWFGRDLPAMAEALEAEPVLLVLRDPPEGLDWVTVFPVDSSTIPNDHLSYAVTWFLLAIAWLGMTAFLVWRISRQTT